MIVSTTQDESHCVFMEAKVGPYISSMMRNRVGMREAGFNSSINGQLALKYRFATALQDTQHGGGPIEESLALVAQYRSCLQDHRFEPRRLAKPDIVRTFCDYGLIGLPEDRWCYVALTWDIEERAFFNDQFVTREDGLPRFVQADGTDSYATIKPRLGWLGYQNLHSALSLGDVADYQAVFSTMIPALEPDAQAYAVAESGFLGKDTSPDSLTLAAKFRQLFVGYKIIESKGSFSVIEDGQTVAKIIPKRDRVFIGIRDTKSPQKWFAGPLDHVSIRGVQFLGLYVPVEHPDDVPLATLVHGFTRPTELDQ